MAAVLEQKQAARQLAASGRKELHARDEGAAALALAHAHFPVSPEPGFSIVSGYYPYQSEISVLPLLGRLAGDGWATCLPVVLGMGLPLEFRSWYPGEPTISGKWGIPRPAESAVQVEPDVLLVPLLAFDRVGYRLGYGGGFYDRTLSMLRAKKRVIAIGVAFSGQEIDAVPRDMTDQALDFVLTETGLVSLTHGGPANAQ
jgi:5-formyltetrahydrofolate cyclo-ligase